jgi:hypothetical protein
MCGISMGARLFPWGEHSPPGTNTFISLGANFTLGALFHPWPTSPRGGAKIKTKQASARVYAEVLLKMHSQLDGTDVINLLVSGLQRLAGEGGSEGLGRKFGQSFFSLRQGCQMVSFRTENPNFGKLLRVLQWKMLVYFMAIWSIFNTIWHILWPFGISSLVLVHFTNFGMLYQEKSGNPAAETTGRRQMAGKNFFAKKGFIRYLGRADAGLPDGIFSNQFG